MYATSSAVHGSFPTGSQPPEPSKFGKSCKFSDVRTACVCGVWRAQAKGCGVWRSPQAFHVHRTLDRSWCLGTARVTRSLTPARAPRLFRAQLYVGARSKSEGLITGLDKSKIHKAFDQGF